MDAQFRRVPTRLAQGGTSFLINKAIFAGDAKPPVAPTSCA
jgi:hypothetical protein